MFMNDMSGGNETRVINIELLGNRTQVDCPLPPSLPPSSARLLGQVDLVTLCH